MIIHGGINMQINASGKNLIVKIDGDIDHHVSMQIKEKIEREFKLLNCTNIIFDFSNVKFMDSSGIGMIIGRYKMLEKLGGKIYITNVNEKLNSIIEISGLKKIIGFYDSVEKALKN